MRPLHVLVKPFNGLQGDIQVADTEVPSLIWPIHNTQSAVYSLLTCRLYILSDGLLAFFENRVLKNIFVPKKDKVTDRRLERNV